jgi:hypothetical protein
LFVVRFSFPNVVITIAIGVVVAIGFIYHRNFTESPVTFWQLDS